MLAAGRSIGAAATGPAKTCTSASARGRKEQVSGAIRVLPLTGISRPRHQRKPSSEALFRIRRRASLASGGPVLLPHHPPPPAGWSGVPQGRGRTPASPYDTARSPDTSASPSIAVPANWPLDHEAVAERQRHDRDLGAAANRIVSEAGALRAEVPRSSVLSRRAAPLRSVRPVRLRRWAAWSAGLAAAGGPFRGPCAPWSNE